MTNGVRRVEISDSPLTLEQKLRVWGRRVWKFLNPPSRPMRGRVDVLKAQEEGRLIPPELLVHAVGPGRIAARSRFKARMTLRVYRADTGKWSEPFSADSVDIKVEQPKEG